MLGAGSFGDLHGHRRVVLAGLAQFGIASLGCALAPSPGALIAFRVLQGVGAALLLPSTLAVIVRAFPERGDRARAIGVWAGIGAAALPAGPLLGGALVDGIGWRAVFLVNVPIVVLAFVIARRAVAESEPAGGRRMDAAGLVLGALALAGATFAIIELGRAGLGPWVVTAAAVSCAAAGAFVAVERRVSDPLLPLGLFRRPGFGRANAIAGTMNLVSLGLLFVLALYLQGVQGRSPLAAGLAVVPQMLPLVLLGPPAGRLVARVGPAGPMAAGLLIAALGIALLARVDAESSYATLLEATLPWGVGLGVLTPAVVAAAVGAVEPEQAGLASAVNNTARQACGAIGIAAFGALAGDPHGSGFLAAFHAAALAGAALYAGAAVVALSPAVSRRVAAASTTK